MLRMVQGIAAALLSVVMTTSLTLAQEVSSIAFEGHAFDAKTLRPLENVFVTYAFTTSGGLGGDFGANTNASGFYQIEFPPANQPLATVVLSAACRTKKTTVRSVAPAYTTLRAQIYRRDFYVTLPKGVTKCNP